MHPTELNFILLSYPAPSEPCFAFLATLHPTELRCTLLSRGGHRHLQIGRMLDIDLIPEPPPPPPPQMYVSKVWEPVWLEGQEAIHS
jgi:hypothetical protein